MTRVRTHDEIDARSLALHQVVAAKIRADAMLLEHVRKTLVRWRVSVCASSQPYVAAWQQLLDQGMDACLGVACEDTERGRAMRQASPFAGVLTNRERREFFKQWSARNASR